MFLWESGKLTSPPWHAPPTLHDKGPYCANMKTCPGHWPRGSFLLTVCCSPLSTGHNRGSTGSIRKAGKGGVAHQAEMQEGGNNRDVWDDICITYCIFPYVKTPQCTQWGYMRNKKQEGKDLNTNWMQKASQRRSKWRWLSLKKSFISALKTILILKSRSFVHDIFSLWKWGIFHKMQAVIKEWIQIVV